MQLDVELVTRTELVPADTCAHVSKMAGLATGDHRLFGNLNGYADDVPTLLEPFDRIGYGYSGLTQGGDGWVPVRLEPGERLVARFHQDTGANLSLYAVCGETSRALAYVDVDQVEQEGEVTFGNPSDQPFEGVLRLDGRIQSGPFSLDVLIQ